MAIMPELPGCGQPAIIRVEIVSADTPTGSVYACPQHADDMVSAIQAAGFTAHRMPGGDGVKRCGDGIDFTGTSPRTLAAPAPADVPSEEGEHPAWCARGILCRVDGVHHSRPAPATTTDATAPIRVWLEQVTRPAPGAPMLVLEVAESGEPRYYWLPVEQGRILAHQLRRLLDAAKRSTR